ELSGHIQGCAECAAEVAAMESAWKRLGQDPDVVPSREFREKTLALLEAETLRQLQSRVAPFRPRTNVTPRLLRIAAVLVAAGGGFAAARLLPGGGRPVSAVPVSFGGVERLPVVSQRTLDASRTLPDLAGKPRLANVAFQPADANGKIGVS